MAIPPGPRGLAPLRFVSGGASGTLAFLRETAREFGPISSFQLGPQRIALIDDAELIEDVLVRRQHLFTRDTGALVVRELVGEGVLTYDEPAHVARRRLLQPAFHRSRVAGYATRIVAECERATIGWHAGDELDIGAEMTALTLSIVGATLFGADMRERAEAVRAVVGRFLGRGGLIAILATFGAPVLRALHRPGRSVLFAAERRELEAIIDPIVRERRSHPDGDDLLSMLLAIRDDDGSALDDAAIRNELITMVLAGHETTATALTWTWYLLAQHPEIEAQLHAELDATLDGRAARVDDMPNLRLTAAIFDEALRLYPPAAAFGRRPLEDIDLGGYRLARGTSIFLSPFVTHRNPRYFERPDHFEPQRWFGAPPPKFAFFPFGGGAKMCIGESLARSEAILALATIAMRYRLHARDRTAIEPALGAVLRPVRPIRLTVEERRSPMTA